MKSEAIVLFVDQNKKILNRNLDKSLLAVINPVLELDFKGKAKENICIYLPDSAPARRAILVGLGKKIGAHQLRTAAAVATQSLRSLGISSGVRAVVPNVSGMSVGEVAEALIEGNILVQLEFNKYKSSGGEKNARPKPVAFEFEVDNPKSKKDLSDGLNRGRIISENVNWARRLIMTPGIDLYPEVYADLVLAAIAKSRARSKIKAKVWGPKELKEKKFGGVLGVARGSEHSPRFVVLEYMNGKKGDAPIVLVGKGVTFDSGGLSLKPPQAMETMKYDMAGSASVFGAFRIVSELGLKVNLVAVAPLVENMISSTAIRPGDILTMASGKTVEVLNTDAEGRLILADALFYATTHYKPRAVVDVATLTGACAAAVGEAAAGIYTNSKKLENALNKASEDSHEYIWPMPNFEDFYTQLLKSEVADMKNIGGREAGMSTASIFLKNFVENDIPWAHLDIAGCGWYDAPRDFIGSKGSSGIPIRLLVSFVENFANAKFN